MGSIAKRQQQRSRKVLRTDNNKEIAALKKENQDVNAKLKNKLAECTSMKAQNSLNATNEQLTSTTTQSREKQAKIDAQKRTTESQLKTKDREIALLQQDLARYEENKKTLNNLLDELRGQIGESKEALVLALENARGERDKLSAAEQSAKTLRKENKSSSKSSHS